MAAAMKKYTSVDEYLADFDGEVRTILDTLRQVIREAAPDATEAISYGMPTYKQNGPLVHFAAQKRHIGFYPTPDGVAAFQDELASYATSKGAIQFPVERPIPYDLVRRIVAYRVKENAKKS